MQKDIVERENRELKVNSQLSRQIIEALLMNKRQLADGNSITVDIEHDGLKRTIEIKELG